MREKHQTTGHVVSGQTSNWLSGLAVGFKYSSQYSSFMEIVNLRLNWLSVSASYDVTQL